MGSRGGLAGRLRCELTEFIGRRGELALVLWALGLAVLRSAPAATSTADLEDDER